MQGQKMNKSSKSEKPRQAKGKIGNRSRLNFMVMRGIGKTWKFTLSPTILIIVSLFLGLFIVGSLYIINDYFDKCRVHARLSKQLEAAEAETEKVKRALYRVEQQLAVFQGHVRDGEESIGDPLGDRDLDEENRESAEEGAKDKTPPDDERPSPEPKALVRDLKTVKDGAKLTASFRLENKLKDGGPLKGYIHMIAVGEDADGPQLWTYPKAALKEGLPANYKTGWHFVIKRFKIIQGEFFFDSEAISPTFIKVIVYDHEGELICEKMFEVQ
ncbi:MAG: LapA family protein [Thermodesulfobacteriota bacterium]|nr:LapA family protein [Thermodesulfobacteriota bacterium]